MRLVQYTDLYVYRLGAQANQHVLKEMSRLCHIWKGFAGTQQWGESMTSYQDRDSEELTTMTLYYRPQYNFRVEDTKFIINLAEAVEFYENALLHKIFIEPLFYEPSTNIFFHYADSKICQ